MDTFLNHLGALIIEYPSWSYLFVGLAIIIQGELAVFLSMLLIANNNLGWGQYLIAAPATMFIAETFLYVASRALRNTRFGWRFYKRIKTNRRFQSYMYYLKMNLGKMFVISRFLVGTNFIILILAGWMRTKFGAYLKAYFPAMAMWFIGMTAVAYGLVTGLHAISGEKVFRQLELIVGGGLVIIFAGEHFLRKFIKKAAFTEEKAAEIGRVVEEELETRKQGSFFSKWDEEDAAK